MGCIETNAELLRRYQMAFPGSPAEAYILARGISKETANQFGLGCGAACPSVGKLFSNTETVVFPTSDDSYVVRTLESDCNHEHRYANSGGASRFFNEAAIESSEKPFFITEGAMDALSIIECGGEAVSLNSTVAVPRMLQMLEKKHLAQNVIIAMDTDEAGKKAASELAEGLKKLGIAYYLVTDWNGCKDANELLQKDRAAFELFISKAEAEAKQAHLNEKDKEILDMFMSSRMDNCVHQMLQNIDDNTKRQRISTGIAPLDKALGGGIMPGLHLVAAMSSLGKTTLVIQMVAEMAKQGQDILFFSLEMSRLDLFAKNISRHTFELNPKKFQTLGQSTNDILNGTASASENNELKVHFQKAIQAYQGYADKLNVIEGFDGISIDQLVQFTDDYIRLIGRKPVVVIDYIQLLQATNPKYTDKQNMDYAIKGLKKIAARGITIFAISSLNRASYDSPVSLGSMKETGNLEYCAETVLAIDFQAMYQAMSGKSAKKFDLNAEKSKDRRDVVLTILKNRNGPVGEQINMVFYPRYNYFATTMETYGTPF